MTHLLDINVLVALFDSAHVHHNAAHKWFADVGRASWATCPITENGFVRVVSNPAYTRSSTSPMDAIERLRVFCSQPEHVFWSDMLSITDSAIFESACLRGHQQITDLYLAGLAFRHGGKLATFDTRIPVDAVVGACGTLVEVIPSV